MRLVILELSGSDLLKAFQGAVRVGLQCGSIRFVCLDLRFFAARFRTAGFPVPASIRFLTFLLHLSTQEGVRKQVA